MSVLLFDDRIVSKSVKNSKKLQNYTKALYFVLRFTCKLLERGLVANVVYSEGLGCEFQSCRVLLAFCSKHGYNGWLGSEVPSHDFFCNRPPPEDLSISLPPSPTVTPPATVGHR